MNRQGIWGKFTDFPKAGASREVGGWGSSGRQTLFLTISLSWVSSLEESWLQLTEQFNPSRVAFKIPN